MENLKKLIKPWNIENLHFIIETSSQIKQDIKLLSSDLDAFEAFLNTNANYDILKSISELISNGNSETAELGIGILDSICLTDNTKII